jgi:hypothetical protein
MFPTLGVLSNQLTTMITSSTQNRAHIRRYRFEPLTVRAAARIVDLATAGCVEHWDARAYVQHLASTDRYAGYEASRALYRLARRRAAHGNTGVRRPFRLQRGSQGAALNLNLLQDAR